MGTQRLIIKKLSPQDFDYTVTLFERYFTEASDVIPNMSEQWDESSVISTIKQFATLWDHCWFNCYVGGRPVGFIAGYASESPWNKNIITANIAFVYLTEDQRNMDNFRTMMQEFGSWANLVEAQQITGGDIGINSDRMRKLYEHFGFEPVLLMAKDTL